MLKSRPCFWRRCLQRLNVAMNLPRWTLLLQWYPTGGPIYAGVERDEKLGG